MSRTPLLTFATIKDTNIRSASELASFIRHDDRIRVIFPAEDITANPDDVYVSGEAHKRTARRAEALPYYMTVSSWVSGLAVFSEVALDPVDKNEIAVALAAQLSMHKLEDEFVHSLDGLSDLVRSQING
jgi:hypothetical protein